MEHPLLTIRYQVIIDYPYSPYKIGEIVVDQMFRYGNIFRLALFRDNYPHIFKKLKWWEERILDVMPKHLKFIKSTNSDSGLLLEHNKVYEVIRWARDESKDLWIPFILFKDNRCDIEDFEPASEAEIFL